MANLRLCIMMEQHDEVLIERAEAVALERAVLWVQGSVLTAGELDRLVLG